MLVIASQSDGDEDNSNVFQLSRCLMFFGVPNLGLRNEPLKTMVKGQPNAQLVHDLVVDDDTESHPFLSRLSHDFLSHCKNLQVVSYYETRQSATVHVSYHFQCCEICAQILIYRKLPLGNGVGLVQRH
jgi:hypothetical protein